MANKLLPRIAGKRILLASSSPRRKTILENLGFTFEVAVSGFAEDLDKGKYVGAPERYAVDNAQLKIEHVAQAFSDKTGDYDLLIGCDTVVSMDGEIIEKPRSKQNAIEMLTRLRGREHSVFTGLVLRYKSQSNPSEYVTWTDWAETRVKFWNVPAEMISAYVESGEPMDKAGGYGIQDRGAMLVESISGDYFNVAGFPVNKFIVQMNKIFGFGV